MSSECPFPVYDQYLYRTNSRSRKTGINGAAALIGTSNNTIADITTNLTASTTPRTSPGLAIPVGSFDSPMLKH